MSIQAREWAWSQTIQNPVRKFVLVTLGDFYRNLWGAIAYADEGNLEKLLRAFPQEVHAYLLWTRVGKEAMLAFCNPDHPLMKEIEEGSFIL